jgi:uroporphyrinogen-III synthase
VHYGERDVALLKAITSRGAVVHELCLYEWLLPLDIAPLKALIGEVIAGNCDAVVFTSQIQCRHLFEVAAADRLDADLMTALNERTVVASVGPVCTAALNRFGIVPEVFPDRPKMAPLIAALASYFTAAGSEKGLSK